MKTINTMNHMFISERIKYLTIYIENYNYDNYESCVYLYKIRI